MAASSNTSPTQGRLRGFLHEVLQPVGRRRQALEKEREDRRIPRRQLGRMQVPALVDAVDEGVADVARVQPPRAVDGVTRADRHDRRRAVGEDTSCRRQRDLHDLTREVAGRVPDVLMSGRDLERGRVVERTEVRARHTSGSRGDQRRQGERGRPARRGPPAFPPSLRSQIDPGASRCVRSQASQASASAATSRGAVTFGSVTTKGDGIAPPLVVTSVDMNRSSVRIPRGASCALSGLIRMPMAGGSVRPVMPAATSAAAASAARSSSSSGGRRSRPRSRCGSPRRARAAASRRRAGGRPQAVAASSPNASPSVGRIRRVLVERPQREAAQLARRYRP